VFGDLLQVPKDWKVVLGTLEYEFFSILTEKIMDCGVLFETLGDAHY